jgi:hypothetical protein
MVAVLKAELMRRFKLHKDTGLDNLTKKPTLLGNMKMLGSCLNRVCADDKITYPLRFASKGRFFSGRSLH